MAAVAHASTAVAHRLAFVAPRLAAVPRVVSAPGVVAARAVARRPLPTTVYLRRRVTALVVLALAAVGLAVALRALPGPFGGGPLTASERPGRRVATYVVQPGDTFWDIARRIRPGHDPRPLVAELVAAHGTAVLVPGERLHLPSAG